MPPRNPFHALEDILEAIGKIRTIDAVIRNLEVIGEAAVSVPADFQVEHTKFSLGRHAGHEKRFDSRIFRGRCPDRLGHDRPEDFP